MKYTNNDPENPFTGTYREICVHLGTSLPRAHPERWPGGPWTAVVPVAVEPTKEQKIEIARDNALYSGVMVGGMPVRTDEKTQARMAGAALSVLIDPSYTVPDWKLPSGQFVTLTGKQILAVSQAIRDHVQACYTREAELNAMPAPTDADINSGWPPGAV